MTSCEWWEARGHAGVTWAFNVDRLDSTTYALFQGRDLSLVNEEELKQFLRQLGGTNDREVGGDDVG